MQLLTLELIGRSAVLHLLWCHPEQERGAMLPQRVSLSFPLLALRMVRHTAGGSTAGGRRQRSMRQRALAAGKTRHMAGWSAMGVHMCFGSFLLRSLMVAHGTAEGDKHVKGLRSCAVTKAHHPISSRSLHATSCVVLLHAAQCTRLRPQTALDEAPLPRRAAGIHSSLCNGREAGFRRQAQGHHLQVNAAALVMGYLQ